MKENQFKLSTVLIHYKTKRLAMLLPGHKFIKPVVMLSFSFHVIDKSAIKMRFLCKHLLA